MSVTLNGCFRSQKMLRPYFLFHRPLLGRLCQAAYHTAREMISAAAPDEETLAPGMIAVMQSFGDDLGWNPHVHALVTRGAWDSHGEWVPVPYVDGEAAALVLRHRVFSFLRAERLLHPERIRLLLSWRHSGFSVHTSVTVLPDDRDGLERLACYLLRPPVSLERLHVDEGAQAIAYTARIRPGHDRQATAPEDLNDILARVVMHIPELHRHTIRYYGTYSSVVRARCRREASERAAGQQGEPAPAPPTTAPPNPERRDLRRRWAELLKRIYEADPLVCPRCGPTMRITVPPVVLGVAFITEPCVIQKILRHLATKPADQRSPPHGGEVAA